MLPLVTSSFSPEVSWPPVLRQADGARWGLGISTSGSKLEQFLELLETTMTWLSRALATLGRKETLAWLAPKSFLTRSQSAARRPRRLLTASHLPTSSSNCSSLTDLQKKLSTSPSCMLSRRISPTRPRSTLQWIITGIVTLYIFFRLLKCGCCCWDDDQEDNNDWQIDDFDDQEDNFDDKEHNFDDQEDENNDQEDNNYEKGRQK